MILRFSGTEYCIPSSPGPTVSTSTTYSPTTVPASSTADSFFSTAFISENYDNLFRDSVDAILNNPLHSADFCSKGKLVIDCSIALSLRLDFKSEMFNVVSSVLSSCKDHVLLSQVKENVPGYGLIITVFGL